MAGNKITFQQLREQLQQQSIELQAQFQQQSDEFQARLQTQQEEIQNLTATIDGMAQGFEATQTAIHQFLANQGGVIGRTAAGGVGWFYSGDF